MTAPVRRAGTPAGDRPGTMSALAGLISGLQVLLGEEDPLARARACPALAARARAVLADVRAAAIAEGAGTGHGGKSRVARDLGITPAQVGDILSGRWRAGSGAPS